jgi:hypothetical protein
VADLEEVALVNAFGVADVSIAIAKVVVENPLDLA